jgi:chemotaxis protein histidine kinase CheA/ActR/RegA family two-component response regulator
VTDWDADELRSLRAFFLDEAEEHLETVARELAALRTRSGESSTVTSLLRTLHTIKGSAGSVELPDVARAAHAFEDRLIELRTAPTTTEAALPSLEAALADMRALVDASRAHVRADAHAHAHPAPPLADDATATPRHDRRAVERNVSGAEQTVRVEVERIDELMDAASELVFDRTRIARRLLDVETRARALGDGDLVRLVAAVHDDLEGLRRTSATLQDRIRRVRRVEIGRLFARLVQPVRELARKEKKEVTLSLDGEETEIDKALIERIAEPLLHLLRNAVAHGVEPPEVRRALGKPRQGTVAISARQSDEFVEIVVADDGQGIDLAGVRRALVAAGRVDEEAARALDETSLYAALFEPGVSTRVAADDVAGRGVGLDAVREALARMHGTVSVTSHAGQGAAFTVRLPMITVVQEGLLFKVGGQVYAVPAARVEETCDVTLADLELGEDERLHVGDRVLPLVRLGALLGVPPPPGSNQRRAALVMNAGELRFAATCDKVIGPREIVVRSLGPLLSSLPLFAGATISGAGKVQLILDVTRLGEIAQRGVHHDRPARALGLPRVLVVDDSRSIREAASLILGQGGYAIDAVADGWEAWELLQDRPFLALVTDLEMPRLDGWELIARVRRSPELTSMPIVVVSSRAEATRTRVLAAGADNVVDKPLRRKALLDALDRAVSERATIPARR